jgi:subtilase family serine protease
VLAVPPAPLGVAGEADDIPSGIETFVWWDWAGWMSIPDKYDPPGNIWVGLDCSTPASVPDGSKVTKVELHHEITHPYPVDLDVKVYNSNHTWIVRDNQQSPTPNINETKTAYSLFDDDDVKQPWYYRVRDTLAGDSGTLRAMQLYVYYETAEPNLTPYQPAGWSDKIVVSNRTGTNTDDDPLLETDALYVDFAGINNGDGPTSETFYTRLYVDGVLRNTWFADPPLDPGFYVVALDYSIGSLPAGTHKIKVVFDHDNRIDETNEGDNEYTKTIIVCPPDKENLKPYQPTNWSDKIVVSKGKGSNTDDLDLSNNDTLYVDWAGINNGTRATKVPFYTRLYVDGVLRQTWETPPLNPNIYFYVEDYDIGTLSAGTHKIKIVIDHDDRIDECNEGDNEYTKTIVVGGGGPNLTPHKPQDWADKIVVSYRVARNTDDRPLYNTDTLYIDWAAINDGYDPAGPTFRVRLYLDGALETTWTVNLTLSPNWYVAVRDYDIGKLSTGTHTVTIVVDPDDQISEIDEGDNEYTKTFSVSSSPFMPNLTPFKHEDWSDRIVVSNRMGTNTDSSQLTRTDTLYVDWAVINNGRSTAGSFYTLLYIDGIPHTQWHLRTPLPPNWYLPIEDYSIGRLSPGPHTIKIDTDYYSSVNESHEDDNDYTKTINILP